MARTARNVARLGGLAAAIACAPAALAQQQEETLSRRLLEPDANRQSRTFNKTFYAGADNSFDRKARAPTFHHVEKNRPKTFATAPFAGTKPATAQRAFPTRDARLAPIGWVDNATRRAPATRTFATRDAAESRTPSDPAPREAAVADRTADLQPTAQGAIDATQKKGEPLTIDEVRRILNKGN